MEQLFRKLCKTLDKPIAQNMKFSIKECFTKCEQIRSFLQIWSHLLKKLLMGNFIFFQWPFVVEIVLTEAKDPWQ